jgi:hydrogenase nickel incorporation protein HypB
VKIPVVRNILEVNERLAVENRRLFDDHNLLVINLMSSPGAGKTSLLEKTIDVMGDRVRMGVIEGDIQSDQDAQRIARKGIPAVQINTDGACHLDGNMVRETFKALDFNAMDLLIIENVGNLVCPAEFNLGEDFKAMLLSVAEGDDKPAKYPLMFRQSKVLLINKIDLLPYVNCSVEKIREEALRINPELTIFEISCQSGQGLDAWFDWLQQAIDTKQQTTTPKGGGITLRP